MSRYALLLALLVSLTLALAATPRPGPELSPLAAPTSTAAPLASSDLGEARAASHHYGPWRTSRMTFYSWGQYGWPVSARRYPGGGSGYFACGGRYLKTTMGVAHKTLPCGTLVQLRYQGRSITVPVVDRGPFSAGLEFDLTSAACVELLHTSGKCWTFTADWRIVR